MALDNATVLENLKQQKAEIEQQIDGGREMYLKIVGAIEVLEQIVNSKQQEVVEGNAEDRSRSRMSFFQSEIVQTEMKEISDLQEEIYKNVFSFPSMSNKDKLEHVEMLETLLKKQQVLYTRLSLSDDPEPS